MDAKTIVEIISQIGFPIVCCGALFWYVVKEQRSTREAMESLKDVITENSKLLESIVSIITGRDN